MQIQSKKENKLKREYEILVPSTDIEKKIDAKIADIAKTARLDGFRPGKAPLHVVKKTYGPSVKGEVIEQIITQSHVDVIRQEKLKPAFRPKFDAVEFKDGEDLKFKMTFEVLPDVPEVKFEKIKIEKFVAEVDDKQINDGLDRLAKAYKDFVKTERAAKIGDAVLIDFKGFINGEAFKGGEAKDFQLELGSKQFIDTFEEQLVGLKEGEDKKIKVKFPEEYHSKEFAGKQAEFEVKIKEVREAKTPEKNDELARRVGFESIDKLKEEIKKQIEGDFTAMSRTMQKRELFDELEKKCDFDCPEQMADMEFQSIWAQVERDPESKKKSKEKLEKEYRKTAERRVKLGILLSEVGTKNNITVNDQEVSKSIMAKAQQFPGQEKRVFEYYQGNPEAVEDLKGPILEEKVVDFILTKVELKEKKISGDDFIKKIEKMNEESEIG